MSDDAGLIGRTLDVLEAVAVLGEADLAGVARQSGLPRSTAHRIMSALVARGYVAVERRGRYGLGARVLSLAQTSSPEALLRRVARPALVALARRCRATAHLGVLDGDMVTYLVKAPFGRATFHSVEGDQLEAYCSAVGKVLLAMQPEDQIDRYLTSGGFVALTSSTIVDPAALRAELAGVRDRGWAMDDREIANDLRCLGVPIVSQNGYVHAALSISVRADRRDRCEVLAMLEALGDAAAAIGAKISA